MGKERRGALNLIRPSPITVKEAEDLPAFNNSPQNALELFRSNIKEGINNNLITPGMTPVEQRELRLKTMFIENLVWASSASLHNQEEELDPNKASFENLMDSIKKRAQEEQEKRLIVSLQR